jgi:hypothetical protein
MGEAGRVRVLQQALQLYSLVDCTTEVCLLHLPDAIMQVQ